MHEISQRQLILNVCNKWRKQYEPFDKHYPDKRTIYENLKKLDLETCSAKDVADAIGNSTWTRMTCSECRKDVDWVIQVGQEPDYESETANLCRDCAGLVAKCWHDNFDPSLKLEDLPHQKKVAK